MNKKLRRMMQPSMAAYFAVLLLFCVPSFVLRQYWIGGVQVGATLLLLLGYLGKKDKAAADEDGNPILNENGEETLAYTLKKKGFWRLFSLVPTVVAIIAFILTEDMSLPMAFVDKWTILMLLIGLAQVGVAILSRKAKEEAEEETPAEV